MVADRLTGRFITLEGGEGVGKSTLQMALAERLRGMGIDVVTTREPGGTPLAERIRELALRPPENDGWSSMSEALLMNAARSDHLDKLIRPALTNGKWVISDRFSDSTLVYQSVKGGVAKDILLKIEAAVIADTRPDLTLVLDAPKSATDARRTSRGAQTDAFEARPSTFHEAVRSAFQTLAQSDPARCRLIDAGQTAEQVAEAAWQEIKALLSAQRASAP
ncbi:dTMP kinase [Hyphomonas oceanitis]|uniref:dTMP kinase n=1 Tax=Hyphomonas oceanitis TaxID=81033 RepID=UPI0030013D27